MIIAIDGPAGSGKTTISRLLARKLNVSYLDTGATYRVLTLKALRENIDLDDYEKVKTLAETLDIRMEKNKVYLDGEEVSEEIRVPLIDKNISKIAANPMARKVLVNIQRKMAESGDFVAEGRDVTTVVFPGAKFKFYMDAFYFERVKRRHKELKEKEVNISLEELTEQVRKRDESDFTRKNSPLKKAADAVYVDTTNLTLEQVVDKLLSYIEIGDRLKDD